MAEITADGSVSDVRIRRRKSLLTASAENIIPVNDGIREKADVKITAVRGVILTVYLHSSPVVRNRTVNISAISPSVSGDAISQRIPVRSPQNIPANSFSAIAMQVPRGTKSNTGKGNRVAGMIMNCKMYAMRINEK